jgi:uncharacterized protein (DUF2141 family)
MRLFLITFGVCLAGLPALAGELVVTVTGAVPEQGQLQMTLFNAPEHWMRDPFAEATVPVNNDGTAVITVTDLALGQSGVSIVYDQNANGKLDTNILGIPTEPFGFSNNASAPFGPPDWEKSVFTVNDDTRTISVELGRAVQN